jgi:twitching motility protein PilI
VNGAASPADPLQLLRSLAAAYAAGAAQLPARIDPAPTETLIAFQLAGCRALIDLAWLTEILPVPPLSRVPQVQPWVRGIANVRGKLLPVIDGAEFLGAPRPPSRQQRILVVVHEDFAAGIIVDRVEGLRRFPHDAYVAPEQLAPSPLRRYAAGGLAEPSQGTAPLFRPALLFQDPAFRDLSLRDPGPPSPELRSPD